MNSIIVFIIIYPKINKWCRIGDTFLSPIDLGSDAPKPLIGSIRAVPSDIRETASKVIARHFIRLSRQ